MFKWTKYAHDVVLTSMWPRFNVMDVVWTSKRRCVLTGKLQSWQKVINVINLPLFSHFQCCKIHDNASISKLNTEAGRESIFRRILGRFFSQYLNARIVLVLEVGQFSDYFRTFSNRQRVVHQSKGLTIKIYLL